MAFEAKLLAPSNQNVNWFIHSDFHPCLIIFENFSNPVRQNQKSMVNFTYPKCEQGHSFSLKGGQNMPVESHIDSLKMRHQELDIQLEEMKIASSADQIELRNLKQKKLAIKDKIERLTAQKMN